MSDFIDIIIRAQDLAGGQIAKVAAELEALKLTTRDTGNEVDALGARLGKLRSNAPDIGGTLRQLENLKTEAANTEKGIGELDLALQSLERNQRSASRIAPDQGPFSPQKLRANINAVHDLAAAENALFDLRKSHSTNLENQNDALDRFVLQVERLKTETRSIGSSLRGEGLGAFGLAFQNLAKDMETSNFQFAATQEWIRGLRQSFVDLDKEFPGTLEKFDRLNGLMTEQNVNTLRASSAIDRLKNSFSQARSDINGFSRDLRALGATSAANDLERLAQSHANKFSNFDTIRANLGAEIVKLRALGSQFDPIADDLTRRMEQIGSEEFKASVNADKFSASVARTRAQLDQLARGVDPLSAAGRQITHMRQEIDSLEHPLTAAEKSARALGQSFNEANFPGADSKRLQNIAKDSEQLGDELNKLGTAAQNGGARFQQFERDTNSLRSVFSRLGAKNVTSDLTRLSRELQLSDVGSAKLKLNQLKQSIHELGLQDTDPLKARLVNLVKEVDRGFEQFALDVKDGRLQLVQFEKDTQAFGRTLTNAGFPIIGAQVDQIGNKAFRSSQGFSRMADEFERSARQARTSLSPAMQKAALDLDRLKLRFETAAISARRLEEGLKRSVFSLDGMAARATRLGSSLGIASTEMERLKQSTASGSGVFSIFIRTLTVWASRMAILVFAFTGLTGVVGPLVGVVGSLVGGVTSLVGAFGQLAGVLAGIPGLLAAVGGSMLAIRSVLQPQGILQAVSGVIAAQKTQAGNNAKGGGTGSASSAQQTLKDAQQSLTDAETNLHDLRISDRQQEQSAELALQQARVQAAQQAIQAERDLIAVRRQAKLQEDALRADVQNAKSSLQGLRAEGASPAEILAAQSDVRIAERALTEQQITDQHDIGTAQQKVHDARVNGALAIKQAEQSLANTIRTNARQEVAAQEQVVKAMRAVAKAQLAVKDGLTGSSSAANTFRAGIQRALFGLDPAARRLVFQILALRDAFHDLTRGVRDRGYTIFSQFITFLQANLRPIVAVINLFAVAVENVAQRLFHFIESPKVFAQIQSLFINSVPLVEKFGEALIPLIDIFLKIGNAAVPFVNFVSDGLLKIINFFDKLTTESINNGGFQSFLQGTQDSLTVVVSLIRDLGGLFKNVFSAAAGPGRELLTIFDHYVRSLEAVTGTIKGQRNLHSFFEGQIPVMQALGRLLAAIGHSFIAVTEALSHGPQGHNTLVDFLDRLSTGLIPFLTEFLTKFSIGVGGAFVNLIAAIGNLALALADLTKPLAAVINIFAALTSNIAKLLSFIETRFPHAIETVASLGVAFLLFSKTSGPLNGLVDGLSKKFLGLGVALNILLVRFRLLVLALLVLNNFVDVGRLLDTFVVGPIEAIARAIGAVLAQLGFLQPLLTTSTVAFKLLGIAVTAALAFDFLAALGRTATAFQAVGGVIDALLVKIGLKVAGDRAMTVSSDAVVIAIHQQTLATLRLEAAQLAQAGASADVIAANAEQIASYELLTAAETEAAAAGGGAAAGPALGGLARFLKFIFIPIVAVATDAIIFLGAALFGVELPFIAAAAVVVGLVAAFVLLVTHLDQVKNAFFGFLHVAEGVAGKVGDLFGKLNDDFNKFVWHGDFSGFVDDAKAAAKAAAGIFSGPAIPDAGNVFKGAPLAHSLRPSLLPSSEEVKSQAHLLGTDAVFAFLDGTKPLKDGLKGALKVAFEDAMNAVKARVSLDLAQLQNQFVGFSSAVGAILGAITETNLTPAERKLQRLQTEDQRSALEAAVRDAKGAAAKAAAQRQLDEFNLQQRANRQRREQNVLNQIQSAGQNAQLQNLQDFLSRKDVTYQQKEDAINRFLKRNNLTRIDLQKRFGRTEGLAYFNALQKSLRPVRQTIKDLNDTVNVALGLAGDALQVSNPKAPAKHGHGPHASLGDITAGSAAAAAREQAKQLGIASDVVKKFGILGENAGRSLGTGITVGLRAYSKVLPQTIQQYVTGQAKKALGITSPSKVFQKIGANVVEGFILGLGTLRHKFAVAFAKIGSNTADFFVQMAEFAKGKNGWGAFTKVFSQTIPATFPGIRAHVQKLWDGLLGDHDTFWDKFEKRQAKGWATIQSMFTKMFPATFDTIAKAIGGLWLRIGKGVNTGWKYITDSLFSWESDLVDTMNLVLKRVGEKKLNKITKPQIPQTNAPTDFASGGVPYAGSTGYGIVRPVPGGVYRVAEAGNKEAIISLDRRYRNRSLAIIEYALGNLGIPGFAQGGIAHAAKVEPRFSGIAAASDPPTFPKVSGIIKEVAVAAATMIKAAADKWFGTTIMGGGGFKGAVPSYAVPTSAHIRHNIALGQEMAAGIYGWRGTVFDALRSLWIGESGWNEFAFNASSGAQGIPQFLPGLPGRPTPKGFPSNPPVDPTLQERWGMGYIHGRYGDPLTAFKLWLARSPHWYHEGTAKVPGPVGADVPAVLQAGEMVLTQRHQGMLANLLFGNYVPAPGGGSPPGGLRGSFSEMSGYFKRLLDAVFKLLRGSLGGGHEPGFLIADGNFYSRTRLKNGKGIIPVGSRQMEFSHQMIRDVFNNSSYGLGAMLHELAHSFQLPSIIKRGKSWIEGGAELFMKRFGPSVFANLGPENPAERRQYNAMLADISKERAVIKRTSARLEDKTLTKVEKARLEKRLKREKHELSTLQGKATTFLEDHPSANRKFHRIIFNLAQAEVPAYEKYLATLNEEFAGDASSVTRNQFGHSGGAEKALAVRLAHLDFNRLTDQNRIRETQVEIDRFEKLGTGFGTDTVLENLQKILARYVAALAAALQLEIGFMQGHPGLRKQFPKLYEELLGIVAGDGSGFRNPIPVGGQPLQGQPIQSFRAGGPILPLRYQMGQPVQIEAHVGEWVVNPEQQARLAGVLGGWQEAKRFLFSTVTPDPTRATFATGGPITGSSPTTTSTRPTTTVHAPITINTASPKVDIDYVSRVLEARLGRF